MQEVDDLFQLLLRLLHARDIRKAHSLLIVALELRARLAEAHRHPARALRAPDHEEEDPDQNKNGEPARQQHLPQALLPFWAGADRHVLLVEPRDQIARDHGGEAGERLAVFHLSADLAPTDLDFAYAPGFDTLHQLAEGDLGGVGLDFVPHVEQQCCAEQHRGSEAEVPMAQQVVAQSH